MIRDVLRPRAIELSFVLFGSATAMACNSSSSSPATSANDRDASSNALGDAAVAADASGSGVGTGPGIDAGSGGNGGAGGDAGGSVDSGQTEGGASFDLSRDMSFTKNPNGPWSYGSTSGATLAKSAFVLDLNTANAPPGSFWHLGDGDAGGAYYPYIAQNTSSASAYGSMNGWSARAGEITMEASNSGQYAVARFIAPVAGSFDLTVHAEGVHFNLSTTDVEVTQNDVSLFSAIIDGYGGDPAFHTVEGASPVADYQATITIAAGDVLLFAIGYGANHTNFSDTSGISVHLQQR